MLWAWLAWDTEDLWRSSIKGEPLFLTGDQDVWSRKVDDITQGSLSCLLSPREFWWLSISRDLQFKGSLFLTRSFLVASHSHEAGDRELALALILLFPRARTLSKSLLSSLKPSPSQFHFQPIYSLVPWSSYWSPNLDSPWAPQPMESYPNSLAWYSNPNLSFKTHLPPLLYLCVLGRLNHSLLPGACVLPISQAFSGPITWDAFSLSLEILPTLQDPDQMLPPPPSNIPRPSLRKSLWSLELHFAGAFLLTHSTLFWTSSICVDDVSLLKDGILLKEQWEVRGVSYSCFISHRISLHKLVLMNKWLNSQKSRWAF